MCRQALMLLLMSWLTISTTTMSCSCTEHSSTKQLDAAHVNFNNSVRPGRATSLATCTEKLTIPKVHIACSAQTMPNDIQCLIERSRMLKYAGPCQHAGLTAQCWLPTASRPPYCKERPGIDLAKFWPVTSDSSMPDCWCFMWATGCHSGADKGRFRS